MMLRKIINMKYVENGREAFICGDQCITYQQYVNDVKNVSGYLVKNEIFRKKIGILMNEPYNDTVALLGVMDSGNVCIPLTLKYGIDLCRKIIVETEIDILLTEIFDVNIISEIVKEDTLLLNYCNVIKEKSALEESLYPDFDINEIALIMHTSGTTGHPKGAMLSYDNILSNLNMFCAEFSLKEDDRFLILKSFYHVAAITGELLTGLKYGCTLVLYNGIFLPQKILSTIERKRCSVLAVTPTQINKLCTYAKRYDLSSIETIIISGEILQEVVIKKIRDNFPKVKLYNAYGQTEASPRIALLKSEDFMRKPKSVGKLLPHIKAKIVEVDSKKVKMKVVNYLYKVLM